MTTQEMPPRWRIAVRDVGVQAERHRCVGVVLRYIGELRQAQGDATTIATLEELALEMEHPLLRIVKRAETVTP